MCIRDRAEANPKRLGFVLYGKDWHQGVIGIVASRIVEVYYRPVLILSLIHIKTFTFIESLFPAFPEAPLKQYFQDKNTLYRKKYQT